MYLLIYVYEKSMLRFTTYSYMHNLKCFNFSTANTISFSQSVYNADEQNEIIQAELVLSNSLPNNTVVQVISNNINATGM